MKLIIADSKGFSFEFKSTSEYTIKIKFIKNKNDLSEERIKKDLVQISYFSFIGVGKFLKIYTKIINVFYFIQLHCHMEKELVPFKI